MTAANVLLGDLIKYARMLGNYRIV